MKVNWNNPLPDTCSPPSAMAVTWVRVKPLVLSNPSTADNSVGSTVGISRKQDCKRRSLISSMPTTTLPYPNSGAVAKAPRSMAPSGICTSKIYWRNIIFAMGGYGGIAYYHVSDTYIALFSHFIPCGVWEAVYILDGLLNNESDIQPDTVHGDTQAQSATVFGLAHLLGITLMPRIRNWQDLTFLRPSKKSKYKHIDSLFSHTANWALIEEYLPTMLRVAMSVKAGKIKASTILRKLGTNSYKNNLFQAFQELGTVLRTGFLLQCINDEELRKTIQAATNKSESFNRFAKWLAFGGEKVIATNNRDEQRKFIKYNHLVANCLIFYNVFQMSKVLNQLVQEGYSFSSEAIAALSPYGTEHINRLGRYQLDLERNPPELLFDLPIVNPDSPNQPEFAEDKKEGSIEGPPKT